MIKTFPSRGIIPSLAVLGLATLACPSCARPATAPQEIPFDFTYKAPSNATQVPFELQDDLPVVRVTVDAGTGPIEARLMVDTGAGTWVALNRPFVDAHKLVDAAQETAVEARPAGLGGTAPFLYREGRSVTFGGVTFEKPQLGFSRARSGSSPPTKS